MWQRLTERGRMAADLAEEIARDAGGVLVVPEHLLAALIRLPDSRAVAILRRLGVRLDLLGAELAEGRETGRTRNEAVAPDPSYTRIFGLAHLVAREVEAPEIGTEHLLVALARMTRHPVSGHLARLGIGPDELLKALATEAGVEAPIGMGTRCSRSRSGEVHWTCWRCWPSRIFQRAGFRPRGERKWRRFGRTSN